MKRVLFISVFLLMLFSCENKKDSYSKELQKIFDFYGGVEAWKNVKSVSFTIGKENFTADLASGKKVINAPNYSLGFDGENYWISDKCSVQNPEKYIEQVSKAFFVPFLFADIEQTDSEKNNAILHFNQTKVFYNPNSFRVEAVEYPNYKVTYQDWQDSIEFTLPKKATIDKNQVEFTNIQLSQATFDDRFYQKP